MRFLLILLLACVTHVSLATHGRCGYIHVRQKNDSKTVVITIVMYTNTVGTSVLFGGDQDFLDFGDGSSAMLVPEQQNIFLPELDYNFKVGYASFVVEHVYPSYGTYKVSYREPNRNAGILNITNSESTYIYFQSGFTIDETPGNYESPVFLNNPLFFSSAESDFSGSLAAYDVNNYTLYYHEMVPLSDRRTPVEGYIRPTNYNLNPHNGLITWDGTFDGSKPPGEFLTTVKIRQFDDDGVVIGYMNVDCQFVREDAENPGIVDDDKDLNSNGRIFTPSESTYSLRVFVIEESSEFPSMTVESELESIEGALNFTTYDSTSGGQKIKVGLLKLTNLTSMARPQPYVISVRGKFAGNLYFRKDINYAFYATDTELPAEPEILMAGESDLKKIQISPNPFNGILSLTGDVTEPLVLNFYSTTGQHTKALSGRCGESLNVDDLPAGMYFVIVSDKHGAIRRREKMIRE